MNEAVAAIKALRERTGAGIMECRRALESAGGDMDKAADIIKELGILQAQKREDRAANEGRVFLKSDGKKATILKLACETDFVARNEGFIRLGEECLARAFEGSARADELLDSVRDAAGRIKENMVLIGPTALCAAEGERIFAYLHGEGRIGAAVCLRASETAWEDAELSRLASDLALHVAAFGPLFLGRDSADPRYLAAKEAEFLSEAAALGKPEAMVRGIVAGKMEKHLAKVCLLDQGFLRDETRRVGEVLRALEAGGGPKVGVAGFLYEKVGS
jgi:elongation factor Ts